MTDRTPTVNRQGTDRASLSVGDAARQLGITPDAVRSRLHRNTLLGVKTGTMWRVYLDAVVDDQPDEPTAPTGNRQGSLLSATGQRQEADSPNQTALIDHLVGEIDYLRGELAQRSRELATERERGDILAREALFRIEALSAGTPPGANVPDGQDMVPADTVSTRPDDPPRSLWRRIRDRSG